MTYVENWDRPGAGWRRPWCQGAGRGTAGPEAPAHSAGTAGPVGNADTADPADNAGPAGLAGHDTLPRRAVVVAGCLPAMRDIS